MAALPNLSDTILKEAFINGLRDEIRGEIRVIEPATLRQAMSAAQRVEDRNLLLDQAKQWTKATKSNFSGIQTTSNPYSATTTAHSIHYRTTQPNPNKIHTTTPISFTRSNPINPTQPINNTTPVTTDNRLPVATSSSSNSNTRPPIAKAPEYTGGMRRLPFRRLSGAEQHAKYLKGLCFRCDEPYGPNHRCRQSPCKS